MCAKRNQKLTLFLFSAALTQKRSEWRTIKSHYVALWEQLPTCRDRECVRNWFLILSQKVSAPKKDSSPLNLSISNNRIGNLWRFDFECTQWTSNKQSRRNVPIPMHYSKTDPSHTSNSFFSLAQNHYYCIYPIKIYPKFSPRQDTFFPSTNIWFQILLSWVLWRPR